VGCPACDVLPCSSEDPAVRFIVPDTPERTMRHVSAAALLLLVFVSAAAAQPQDYRSVVTPAAQTDRGLFDVHRVGERILFEIPDSVLGRDMALMSRYASTQDGLANGGDRMAPNMVVQWERRGERVLLRAISHSSSAE